MASTKSSRGNGSYTAKVFKIRGQLIIIFATNDDYRDDASLFQGLRLSQKRHLFKKMLHRPVSTTVAFYTTAHVRCPFTTAFRMLVVGVLCNNI